MVWCVANHENRQEAGRKKDLVFPERGKKKHVVFSYVPTLIASCCGNRLTIATHRGSVGR